MDHIDDCHDDKEEIGIDEDEEKEDIDNGDVDDENGIVVRFEDEDAHD